MNVTVLQAHSIAKAFEVAVDFIADWAINDPPFCWFRGTKSTKLKLVPGAYWRSSYDEFESLITFAQEGVAFRNIGSIDDWDTYYLAQHHGVPTRLLDWTESFGAALFFAFDGWDGKSTPCIWILQPCVFNEVFLKWHGILAPENIPESSLWLPRQVARDRNLIRQDPDGYVYDNQWPLAIYPKKTNRRIHAQQGAFTIHGIRREPLDELLDMKCDNVSQQLARLELVGFDHASVHSELSMLGIRRSAIYPDIDNFVKQMKQDLSW